MPFPISYSFRMKSRGAPPARVMGAIEAWARRTSKERGAASISVARAGEALVLETSPIWSGAVRRPLGAASRVEILEDSRPGETALRVRVDFTEAVQGGVFVSFVTAFAAAFSRRHWLEVTPARYPLMLLVPVALWIFAYLYGVAKIRWWARKMAAAA